ncbi:hypothetical protein MUGA111182_18155 [Mucilaginibacter galii]|uniref:hypothetical protein n=1 Tax=Mucilaginibacter galii TaxID=2005073 RepID=UPI00166E2C82|nr:hypothetical protein [Mucilaginibacter galii]
MNDFFQILNEYQGVFWDGFWVTIQLCLIVWITGISQGIILSIIAYKVPIPFFYIFQLLTLLIISVPFLITLYWFYYPFQALIGRNFSPFVTAAFTLSFINTFLVYQVLISSLRNFPNQIADTASVCGLSSIDVLRKIKIPIILRKSIPGIVMLQIFILQTSIFSGAISVQEIFKKAQLINSEVQQPVTIYSAMAVFFIFLCFPIYLLSIYYNQKYTKELAEK